jgi:alkylation response protein AidB-like acyl-CoA dehydrogenase
VARSADAELKRRLLSGVAEGEIMLTAAMREPSRPMPLAPSTTATLAGGLSTVSGVKVGVPYAAAARWILVPASTDTGDTVVVIVEPDADGLTCQRTRSSSGLPEYTIRLDESPILHVLDGCSARDLNDLAVAGACAVADGVLAAALDLTTEHVRTREQFGRPLATFQAVAQQIADVYAAARTLHLTTVSACWQLDTGRDAGRDADVAAYWLAEHGPAALRTCHHLHGGLGMDITYPLPRYSALMTDLVAFVGGAADRLDRLGAREAATA